MWLRRMNGSSSLWMTCLWMKLDFVQEMILLWGPALVQNPTEAFGCKTEARANRSSKNVTPAKTDFLLKIAHEAECGCAR